jgi:hypothetical protein
MQMTTSGTLRLRCRGKFPHSRSLSRTTPTNRDTMGEGYMTFSVSLESSQEWTSFSRCERSECTGEGRRSRTVFCAEVRMRVW